MNATAQLHALGQSLWLDNITRDLLESGTLARYIAEWSVTGLTSNPTIFDHAIKGSNDYDAAIRSKLRAGKSGVAFAMYPTSLDELFRVADAGLIMPPKSTWFEPKLADGLFVHAFEMDHGR